MHTSSLLAIVVSIVTIAFLPTAQVHAQTPGSASIRDLPLLSPMLVRHWECRLALELQPSNDFKEVNFRFSPQLAGHQSLDQVLSLRDDQVTASANSQALQLKWTRAGRLVASSLSMIQNSPTQAMVLIVHDPSQPNSHADLGCSAVSFAEPGNSTGATP